MQLLLPLLSSARSTGGSGHLACKHTLVHTPDTCFGHLGKPESVGPGIGGGEVGEAGGQEQGWGEEEEEKRNLSRTSWFGNYLNVQGGTESMLKG